MLESLSVMHAASYGDMTGNRAFLLITFAGRVCPELIKTCATFADGKAYKGFDVQHVDQYCVC